MQLSLREANQNGKFTPSFWSAATCRRFCLATRQRDFVASSILLWCRDLSPLS